jgi:hypothetical protein
MSNIAEYALCLNDDHAIPASPWFKDSSTPRLKFNDSWTNEDSFIQNVDISSVNPPNASPVDRHTYPKDHYVLLNKIAQYVTFTNVIHAKKSFSSAVSAG